MWPEDQHRFLVPSQFTHATLVKLSQSGAHCGGTSLLSHADGWLSLPHSCFISSVSIHTLQREDGVNEHNPSVRPCDLPFPTKSRDQQKARGELLCGDIR